METLLSGQAERLYEVYAELARAFQFRDRERTTCFGISVSGCHALELLIARGPMTMSELAAELYLGNSTVTRLVDRLAGDGLAVRRPDPEDGRICRVHPTEPARELMEAVRGRLVAEQAQVLQALPAASREPVIAAFGLLLKAFRARQRDQEEGACGAPTEEE